MRPVNRQPERKASAARTFGERPVVAGLALGALVVLGALAWRMVGHTASQQPGPAAQMAASGRPLPVDAPSAEFAKPALADGARQAEAFAHWLAHDSSLRGAALDGDWGIDATGALRPSRALRRRFDQLLTLQGERGLDDITRYIGAEVERQHGAAAARAVLERFKAYLALLGTTYRTNPSSADRELLAAALAERHSSRQQILGKVWADAFYAEEEAALRAFIDSSVTAVAAVTPDPATAVIGPSGLDERALDPAARERLAVERASWQAWEARLQAAREAQAGLLKAPELSAPQREAAVDAWLAEHFEGSELRRVRALLLQASK